MRELSIQQEIIIPMGGFHVEKTGELGELAIGGLTKAGKAMGGIGMDKVIGSVQGSTLYGDDDMQLITPVSGELGV